MDKNKPFDYIVVHQIPLEEEDWYHGEVSRDDAIKLVKDDGDYLVRFSNAQTTHILTAKWDGKIKHFIFDEWHDQVKQYEIRICK